MSWFLRVELKPACILLVVVTVTFFTRPDLLPLQNQLYLCLQSKNHIAFITHQSEQTCALILTFSEIEGQQAYSGSFFCCSSNSSQSFFHFLLHGFVFQCTVKVSVLYKNNFLYANCPFQSDRERQLPAVTSKQLTLCP